MNDVLVIANDILVMANDVLVIANAVKQSLNDSFGMLPDLMGDRNGDDVRTINFK
ncbi:MAG TPA: hypothetical protein ACFE0H_10465 [Elainellaceae cyanobacterium]